ncbi:MAG: hypothetical protein DKT66_12820 [Candidatus Melainabacteria bacterium]|nr:MAG: hypothetical protein DKT66_12820 [Candidatus Melainabacteria bacterium]
MADNFSLFRARHPALKYNRLAEPLGATSPAEQVFSQLSARHCLGFQAKLGALAAAAVQKICFCLGLLLGF